MTEPRRTPGPEYAGWFRWCDLTDEMLEQKRKVWAAMPCLDVHSDLSGKCDRCEALDDIEAEQSKRADQRRADEFAEQQTIADLYHQQNHGRGQW